MSSLELGRGRIVLGCSHPCVRAADVWERRQLTKSGVVELRFRDLVEGKDLSASIERAYGNDGTLRPSPARLQFARHGEGAGRCLVCWAWQLTGDECRRLDGTNPILLP